MVPAAEKLNGELAALLEKESDSEAFKTAALAVAKEFQAQMEEVQKKAFAQPAPDGK
jgi:hypothetical protein